MNDYFTNVGTPRWVPEGRPFAVSSGNRVVNDAKRFTFELLHELRKRGVWFYGHSAYGESCNNTIQVGESSRFTAHVSISDVAYHAPCHGRTQVNNFPLCFTWRDEGTLVFRAHSHTFLVTESRDPATVAEELTATVNVNGEPRPLIDVGFWNFIGRQEEVDWVHDRLFRQPVGE